MPIVEPEVLMDGDNTIETCDDVTGRTLRALYAALYEQDIHLRGTLLKPNMVIAGKGCPTQDPPETVASSDGAQLQAPRAGARARDRLPLGRPERGAGDGEPERHQPRRRAVAALVLVRPRVAGVCARGVGRRSANLEAAQAAFVHRARMNSLAVAGEWSAERRAGGRRLDSRRANAASSSDDATTLPGFMIPCGSKSALTPR